VLVIDSADRPMAGKEVEVLFLLDQAPPPGTYLAPDTFLTGCTPIINLFQTTTDPIRLDHRKSEYRLVADVRRERTTEIHSIQMVSASRDPRLENTIIPPYYSFQHGREASAFWHSRRTFALGDMPGTDVYLSFLDLHFRNSVPPAQTVYAHVLCTNRELARELDERTELKMENAPHSARMLMKPTLPASPPLEGPTTWALVSNLALNYLSFSSGKESLKALKEMLKLYSFADRTATLQKVDWIHDMSCRHIAHRMPGDAWRGFCRGTEVSLVFDDNARLGSGVRRHAARAAAARHRGHVHDLARLLADHHAADGLREEEDAGEVRAQHRVPLLARQVFEARADAVARVVDEQVDTAELGDGSRDDVVHLGGVAHIASDRQSAASVAAHLFGDGVERAVAAAARHHVSADRRQLDGNRSADALAGARHDGDAIAKRVRRKSHAVLPARGPAGPPARKG